MYFSLDFSTEKNRQEIVAGHENSKVDRKYLRRFFQDFK
jgi:hypothetical protein